MKWVFFFVVSAIVVFVTTLYFNLGGHKEVLLEENFQSPGMHVIYKMHSGPYHKILGTIETVENWATANNIPCRKTFGEYLDDPHSADESRLRSNGGCVVSQPAANLPEGFEQRFIEPAKYLKATFEGAPSIGPFKVYPKAEQWAKENRLTFAGPIIEIYTILGPKTVVTEYLFPLP